MARTLSRMLSSSCGAQQGDLADEHCQGVHVRVPLGTVFLLGAGSRARASSVWHLPWPIVSFEWISWPPAVTSKAPVPHWSSTMVSRILAQNSLWRKPWSAPASLLLDHPPQKRISTGTCAIVLSDDEGEDVASAPS